MKLRFLLIIAVVLIIPFFFVGGPSETSPPVYRALWNLGHIGFFGMVTMILLAWVPLLRPASGAGGELRPVLILSALVLGVGVMIEILQYQTFRDPDLHDIWRNMLGAWLVMAWQYRPHPVRQLSLIVLVFFLVFEFFLIGRIGWTDWTIQHQLPLVSELENPRDVNQWSGDVTLTREVAAAGESSLRVQLDTSLYSGATLDHLPGDWRGYHWLKFQVFNPDESPLQLTLRINDKEHEHRKSPYRDRFNTTLVARRGWNPIQIDLEQVKQRPENRQMDMDEIFKIVIFAIRLPEPRVMYLDDFRLE